MEITLSQQLSLALPAQPELLVLQEQEALVTQQEQADRAIHQLTTKQADQDLVIIEHQPGLLIATRATEVLLNDHRATLVIQTEAIVHLVEPIGLAM